MDHALVKIGLPVKCGFGDCKTKGFVRPQNYGGWYKSQMFRLRKHKRWYCPEHAAKAQEWDDRFYERYATPEPTPDIAPEETEDATSELYKLLD